MNAPDSQKHLYCLPMQTTALEMNIAATGDVSYANVLRHCMQGDGLEIRVVDSEAINAMAQFKSDNVVSNTWGAMPNLDHNMVSVCNRANKGWCWCLSNDCSSADRRMIT